MKNWKCKKALYSATVAVSKGETICITAEDKGEEICLAVIGDPDLAPEAEKQGLLMADAPKMLKLLDESLATLGYVSQKGEESEVLYNKVRVLVEKHTV